MMLSPELVEAARKIGYAIQDVGRAFAEMGETLLETIKKGMYPADWEKLVRKARKYEMYNRRYARRGARMERKLRGKKK